MNAKAIIAVVLAFATVPVFAAPSLECQLKSLPGATNYVFHLRRDKYTDTLGLEFDTLGPDGYYLVRRGRDIVAAGRTASGNAFALADLLKRWAGYRNFGARFGLVPPHTDDLLFPDEFTFREEPDVPSVNVAGGIGAFGRDGRLRCQATHALSRMVKKEFWPQHPEYFPLVNGKRIQPGVKGSPWNPCMSNPDLPQLFDSYADEYFKKWPEAFGLPMGVNDGGGDCQCEGCETIWRKYGNQYAVFYNMAAKRLATSHPGKLLAFIAYSSRCKHVPKGLAMETNILVEVTGMVDDMFGELRKWRDAGVKNFGIYEYMYGGNSSRIAPGHYPHYAAEYFRKLYREFGFKTFWEEYFAWTPVTDACRQYVINELMWNMDADVDALVGDYFSSLYGPAEDAVRRFHEIAEAAFIRRRAKKDWRRFIDDHGNPRQFEGYSFEDISEMDKALAEASRTAASNADAARRVRLLSRWWEFQRLMIESWTCARKLAALGVVADVCGMARRGLSAVRRAERFVMTPDEEYWMTTSNRGWPPLPSVFTGRMAPRPILEQAIDDAFSRITGKLGASKARKAWKRILETDPELAPYAGTQLSILNCQSANLAKNASFEELADASGMPMMAASDCKPVSRLAGRCWASWRYPNTKAVVSIDSSVAHSGTNSICIIRNQHGAAVLTSVRVTPRARYRVSAWVKASNPRGREVDLGGFSVRMKTVNGKWLDNGSAIGAKIPSKAVGEWVKVSCTFTTPDIPDDGLFMEPTFGAPCEQGEGDCIWWDDVTVEKLWESSLSENIADGGLSLPG